MARAKKASVFSFQIPMQELESKYRSLSKPKHFEKKVTILAAKTVGSDKKVISASQFLRRANTYVEKDVEFFVETDEPEMVQALSLALPVIRGKIKILGRFNYLCAADVEDLRSVGVVAFYEVLDDRGIDVKAIDCISPEVVDYVRYAMEGFWKKQKDQGRVKERLVVLSTSGNKKHRQGKKGVDVTLETVGGLMTDAERIHVAINRLTDANDDVAILIAQALMIGMKHAEISAYLGITRLAMVQAILRIEKALTITE